MTDEKKRNALVKEIEINCTWVEHIEGLGGEERVSKEMVANFILSRDREKDERIAELEQKIILIEKCKKQAMIILYLCLISTMSLSRKSRSW
jgi:hypothetical protein